MHNDSDRNEFRNISKARKKDIINVKKDYEKELSRRAKTEPK